MSVWLDAWLASASEALGDPGLIFAAGLTARSCLTAGAGFLLAASPIAWALARKPVPLVRAASFLVMLPLVFPPIAHGYILLLIFGRNTPASSILASMDVSILFTPAACALAAFTAGLPLAVRSLQAAFSSERLSELEAAARLCGASPRTVFLRVTLPLLKPQILSSLLLGISRAMGEVGITMMAGGNIADKTNTLSLEIYNAVSRADFEAASWLCLLLSASTLAVFLILDQLERRSDTL